MEKDIVYSNRVLQGHWYESAKYDEFEQNSFYDQMRNGNLLLAKFRKMTDNLNKPVEVTQSMTYLKFGDVTSFLAPYVPCSVPPVEGVNGLLLGGRLDANDIHYVQDLIDGTKLVGLILKETLARNVFQICSSDYCDREGEPLKYNQEFMLGLKSSMDKQPLYMRHDLDPVPGLTGVYTVYLSKNPVSACRWRILPKLSPKITRFEQEGKVVPVNTDIIINHCSTNLNLGIRLGSWTMGFHGNVCALVMEKSLDIYGNDKPHLLWQMYVPIQSK